MRAGVHCHLSRRNVISWLSAVKAPLLKKLRSNLLKKFSDSQFPRFGQRFFMCQVICCRFFKFLRCFFSQKNSFQML